MVEIENIEASFKGLQEYSNSQYYLILSLKREVEKLKSENDSFRQLLESNLPSIEFNPPQLTISNEQLICETQISILKERAILKELNADEVRRFTLLFDVLEKIKQSSSSIDDIRVKQMSNEELLQLVVNNEPNK